MTSFEHKYKDRTPLETVNILHTFFIKQGYNISVTRNEQTEAGTFWCHLELKDENHSTILTSNGKGASMEYSLASGYAELYERYCAGFSTNKKFFEKYNTNFFEKGYYIDKNEKFLTLDEIKNSSAIIQTFFDILDDEDHYIFNAYLNNFKESNTLPCTSFINLRTKDELYLNAELLNFIQGSDGLAAGNTIEEACVQAMSEIYEHYVTDRLYYDNNSNVTYYQLNLQKMKNTFPDYLNNIIKSIESFGYYLSVYDLSYNFNMPVLAAIIIDNNHTAHLNLGAAPVFEIALERTLTEIYQGRIQFQAMECNKYCMKPYRNYSIEHSAYNNVSSITLRDNYPEELLLNKVMVSDYNHNVFLPNKNYNNNDLVEYYISLNQINGFEIFIKDLSQIKEVRAVRLFCSNQLIFPWKHDIYKTIDKNIRLKIQKIAYNLTFKETYCNDNYFSLLEELEAIFENEQIDQVAKNEYLQLIFKENLKIFPVSSLERFFIYLDPISLTMDQNFILKYNYFKSLYFYKNCNQYTDEEIINIFTNGFKYPDSFNVKEDLSNIFDIKYTIRKILIEGKE